ncbi:hypothetical protein RB653_010334 [Dictyostelium firmibasis]|uniref:G-protein coupled receptors family 3 profile domain-containing protein n=1 Tax=Dictyostelium firmibasis TaxID=79012 RepID=A0AAN7TTU7_9MYCE
MKKYIFSLFLIFIFINIKACYGVNLVNFKLITLLTSNFDDLGFNNMLNQGKVNVEKALGITDTKLYVVDGYNDTKALLLPIIQNEDVDFVMCTSLGHVDACKEIAAMYENSTTIKTQFMIRGSFPATSNLLQVTYNYASINYISGVFAGLYTNTKKIGFLSPGLLGGSADCFVYAFWLGAKQINPEIEFYYYNIGSFLNADKTTRATAELIEMGCDVIGDTLDDFSAGNTVIARGYKAMGTNGFPQRNVYGENVIYSYAYNWTKIFLPILKNAMVKGKPKNNYADFNFDPSLNFYDISYGFEVSNDTKTKINNTITYLKSTPRAIHPTNCNDMMLAYAKKWGLNMSTTYDSTKCVAGSNFFFINQPFPGMTYLGYYNITNTEVKFPSSIQTGISIVSGILIALVLFIMVGVYKYRASSSIRSASPIFLIFILFGALIVYGGIILWVSSLNDRVCNGRLWMVTLGFSTLIGSLVVKNFRIWLIFDNPELKTVKITNYQLYPWVACCLVINIVLMSILTSVGDLREIDATGIDSLGKYEFMRICKMNHAGASVLYSILAYFGALLLTGVFVSWKIRIVDIEEFNESRAIAHTLYAISFCLFVIVPLMISPLQKQSETIILSVAGLFITTAAVFIIFLPKFYRVYEYGVEGTNEMFKSKKSSNIATARAESHKSSGSGRTNRRGNLVSGDFSDDSESSISEPNQVADVTSGAVLADFTEESVSDNENDNKDKNKIEDEGVELSNISQPQEIEQQPSEEKNEEQHQPSEEKIEEQQ